MITQEDYDELCDSFDTMDLLDAIRHIGDTRDLRESMDELHTTAMAVINQGAMTQTEDMFDQAEEIDDQLTELIASLERAQRIIQSLTESCPESVYAEYED